MVTCTRQQEMRPKFLPTLWNLTPTILKNKKAGSTN
jgi:hypothetical protein